MDAKSILKSKTFWMNLLLIGADLLGQLPKDANADVLIITVANIILRVWTKQPVTVVSK